MIAPVDDDAHAAGESCERAGARVRHDGDDELAVAACHDAVVLQDERPGASLQRPFDAFHRDVPGGAGDGRPEGEHLTFARGFEITAKLFVEQQPPDRCLTARIRRLGYELHLEWSASMVCHDCASILPRSLDHRYHASTRNMTTPATKMAVRCCVHGSRNAR